MAVLVVVRLQLISQSEFLETTIKGMVGDVFNYVSHYVIVIRFLILAKEIDVANKGQRNACSSRKFSEISS